MSTVYSLVNKKVIVTITVPQKEEVRDLGEKVQVVKDLTAEISKAQAVIDSYTQIKAELQAKLDVIKVL